MHKLTSLQLLRDCYGIQHSEEVLILQRSRLRSQGLYNTLLCIYAWLPQVRKWSGKKILQGQEKVREFHFQSGKNKMFERSQERVNFSQFSLLPLLLVFSNIKILLYMLQTGIMLFDMQVSVVHTQNNNFLKCENSLIFFFLY